jgi:putative SOS response-associated peptidase YedK
MCGRFTLHLPAEVIAEIFGVPLPTGLPPRYNIAPSQLNPVVRLGVEGRQIAPLKWGLIPHWAQDPRLGFSMINARAETIEEKPAFRVPFRSRRCLVVADGFYEWRHEGKTKEPFHITLKSGGVMPFAGLWDHWQSPEGENVESFTIITCAANGLISRLHERMPVIIGPKDYDLWLNPRARLEEAGRLLRPYPDEWMKLSRVGPLVNSPANDSEECIRKV